MTQTMYHGSPTKITTIDRDICLTDDPDIAEGYVTDRGLETGYIHTIELADQAPIADEDDVREAAQAVADHSSGVAALLDCQAWTYELLDEPAVRAELADRGFAGAEFRDISIDNGREHDTIRIWAANIAKIVNVDEIR